MKILVIAQHDNETINPVTYSVITAASKISEDITILVAGYQCLGVAKQLQQCQVKQILVADVEQLQQHLAESMTSLIMQIVQDYQYVMMPATTFGKDILPRIGALLDVTQVSDITKVIDVDTFCRPMYAGSVIATVKVTADKKLITVRPAAFPGCELTAKDIPINQLNLKVDNALSKFVTKQSRDNSRPDLATAKVVVSGGRGLQSKENFALIEQLAEKLNAAIGASRAAVDAGFVANDLQVGQTGKIIAPDLYIGIGISGAVQHLAGIKDSKVIVAINSDPDAAIFEIADYGLVGDLFELVPEIINQL